MPSTTIHAVISDVLRNARRPLTLVEIYDAIVDGQLYEFQSKDPFGIVRNQLKRHCIENQHSCAAKAKYFSQTADNRFTLV